MLTISFALSDSLCVSAWSMWRGRYHPTGKLSYLQIWMFDNRPWECFICTCQIQSWYGSDGHWDILLRLGIEVWVLARFTIWPTSQALSVSSSPDFVISAWRAVWASPVPPHSQPQEWRGSTAQRLPQAGRAQGRWASGRWQAFSHWRNVLSRHVE